MDKKSIRMIIGISLNIILIAAGVVIIFTAGSRAYTFGHNIFDEESVSSQVNAKEIDVTIPKDVTPKQLAKLLYDRGLIKDKTIFYCQVVFSDYKDNFIEGTYTLNTGQTPTEMMQIMTKSNVEEE